jgi:hypothetical protein
MSLGGPTPPQSPPSPADASEPSVSPKELLLLTAKGLALPALLIALIVLILRLHWEDALGAVGITAAAAAVGALFRPIWKAIGEKAFAKALVALLKWLNRREVMIRFAESAAVVVIVGSLMSSLHVYGIAKDFEAQSSEVWIYRMVSPANAPYLAMKTDSVLLQQMHAHGHFRMMPSFGQRTWMLTSTFLRTPDTTFMPWSADQLGYPGRFRPVWALAVLLTQNFAPEISAGRPLRVRIRDDSTNALLADTTLEDGRFVPSLFFAVAAPMKVPDSTVAAWQKTLVEKFPGDTQATHVNGWRTPRWLRPLSQARTGQRVRAEVTRFDGTLLGTSIVTIGELNSHVLITPDN